MRRRRSSGVFGLAFLDAMTCGLGAVVLLYMVINASVGVRTEKVSRDLTGEVDRLEDEVLDGTRGLVELRNAVRKLEERRAAARGLSRRLIENLEEIQVELATYAGDNLAKREHINRLKTDIQTLERDAKRLSAAIPDTDETPGDRLRTFVGDGDRQYLTGLKVGGDRILILVDSSASMLDETVVNIIRRRNLPDARKIRSDKWQRAVSTVDWLTTQLPRQSSFQVYHFNERARPLVDGTDGQWLDAGDRDQLEKTVQSLRQVVPTGGTSLHHAFAAARRLQPDNVILLVDGLPTMGEAPGRGLITGKKRLKLFDQALRVMPNHAPINVILFPMEGDPMAASAFWKLALATRGSFLSPPEDWP